MLHASSAEDLLIREALATRARACFPRPLLRASDTLFEPTQLATTDKPATAVAVTTSTCESSPRSRGCASSYVSWRTSRQQIKKTVVGLRPPAAIMGANYVMNRVFMLLLLAAIGGMFVFHESNDTTVTQEEALTFQEFLASQPEETPVAKAAETRVPGYQRPMFHAENDPDPKAAKAAEPRKMSFEMLNGEEDKWN